MEHQDRSIKSKLKISYSVKHQVGISEANNLSLVKDILVPWEYKVQDRVHNLIQGIKPQEDNMLQFKVLAINILQGEINGQYFKL